MAVANAARPRRIGLAATAAQSHVRTVNPQNPTERDRVIDFRGVLVRDLLDRYRAAAGVTEVTFVAIDGFRSTIDLAGLRAAAAG